MNDESKNSQLEEEIPASLRRRKKEPIQQLQVRIPLSWADELRDFAREYDQTVTTFILEAVEDWLRRARQVREKDQSKKPDPPYPGVTE